MKYKDGVRGILISAFIFIRTLTFSQENEDNFLNLHFPSYIVINDGEYASLSETFYDFDNLKTAKQVPPWFVRRFKVTAGIFLPVNNTKIKVGSNNNSFGTEIDFEDNLGFKKTTATFLSNFQWRASRRSRFDVGYFHLDRSTSYQLQKTVEFGDHTYPVNASVDSYFKINMFLFSYGYAIFLKPKYELGVMIGTHTLSTDLGIKLTGETAQLGYNDKFKFTAPIPDFGIWGGYALSDKFVINGNVNYLSIKVNDFKGEIISYNLALMYQVFPDLDLALGYTGMNFTVDMVKNRLNGYLKWGYNGPSLTASYAFGKRKPFGQP